MARPARPKDDAAARKAPVRLTGAAGTRYENSIAARFLVDMLAGLNSLGSEFGRITQIDWQARDAGWLADDLAVVLLLGGLWLKLGDPGGWAGWAGMTGGSGICPSRADQSGTGHRWPVAMSQHWAGERRLALRPYASSPRS